MTAEQAMQVFEELRSMPADAVYSNGRRLRLVRARLVTTFESNITRIEWGGVKVKRSGTIIAIAVGGAIVEVTPRDVRSGMTFSASAPVEDVAGRSDGLVRSAPADVPRLD